MPTETLSPAEVLALMRKETKARGRHKPGTQNQEEARYEREVLQPAALAGQILAYWFEALTLKLGKDCRYTGDYLVMRNDGLLELHDVKHARKTDGKWRIHIEDDARAKMRVAAEHFPFPVFAVARVEGQWVREEM